MEEEPKDRLKKVYAAVGGKKDEVTIIMIVKEVPWLPLFSCSFSF
jgi:hypothetical protein